jgi:hypothetical protein
MESRKPGSPVGESAVSHVNNARGIAERVCRRQRRAPLIIITLGIYHSAWNYRSSIDVDAGDRADDEDG